MSQNPYFKKLYCFLNPHFIPHDSILKRAVGKVPAAQAASYAFTTTPFILLPFIPDGFLMQGNGILIPWSVSLHKCAAQEGPLR